MANKGVADLSKVGVFRGKVALDAGLTRKQLGVLVADGVVERVLPDTYRMTALPRTNNMLLRAALLWAGDRAAADGRSAGEHFGLEGVRAGKPEIVVPDTVRTRNSEVEIRRVKDLRPLMIRTHEGLRVTGIEPTLGALAHLLDGESFEIACEDARRRQFTSLPALRKYVDRWGTHGRAGVAPMRALLSQLDPVYPSRSTLEVKTRRVLVAHGITDFVREFPLDWNGRTYYFDFAFERRRVILETNGRRWHGDPADHERDTEKWSVPGRHGYRIVFATWERVTQQPQSLVAELRATLAA